MDGWDVSFGPREWGDDEFEGLKGRILLDVEKGDVLDLKELLYGWDGHDDGHFPIFGDTKLESLQSALAALILLAGQAAVRGGVSQVVVNEQAVIDHKCVFRIKNTQEFMAHFKRIAIEYAIKVYTVRGIGGDSAIVRRIDKVIQENVWGKITPTMISGELRMNVSYLCREFKCATGKTIGTYINECKIHEAMRLLRMNLIEISDMLSFSSQSYFHRVFKKVTGKTPSEYRESGIS